MKSAKKQTFDKYEGVELERKTKDSHAAETGECFTVTLIRVLKMVLNFFVYKFFGD